MTCATSPRPGSASGSTAAPSPCRAPWRTTAPAHRSSPRASSASPRAPRRSSPRATASSSTAGRRPWRSSERLPASLTATVITHSPTIAAALVDHPGIEILLLGGRIYKHSAVACGAATAEAAAGISADLFFLGVTGVHPEAGLTTGDADEAAMKRTLAGRAADTYVLASTEKVGAISAYKVLDLAQVDGRRH